MTNLAGIRDAMGQVIDQGTEFELHVYKYADEVNNLPAVIIEPMTGDYDGAMANGMVTWQFNVYILCSRGAGSDDGQEILDQMIDVTGPNSIREILYNNSDLGLPDKLNASATFMKGYGGSFDWAGISHIGAVLLVTVITDGRD
jgi:hypothetical protein